VKENVKGEFMLKLQVLRIPVKLMLGGYDTQFYREINNFKIIEPLRAQSIKGVWRWWARALLAGVLWDKGYRDHLEILVRKLENRLFGQIDPTPLASKFKIETRTGKVYYDIIGRKRGRTPRERLLSLKNEIRIATKLYDTYIIVKPRLGYEDLKDSEKSFAYASLVLGLILSGLGKGSRRGYGVLDFKILEDQTGLFKWIKDSGALGKEHIKKILDKAYSCADEYISEFVEQKPSINDQEIPPIPALYKSSLQQ